MGSRLRGNDVLQLALINQLHARTLCTSLARQTRYTFPIDPKSENVMSNGNAENLKAHLKNLHRSLEEAGEVDDELEMLLRQLDGDIKHVLGRQADQQLDEKTYGLSSRVQALSARFANRHPHLEPTLRELGNILATMGI
jgi:hypothetical protein